MTSYVGSISINENEEKMFGRTMFGELVEYVSSNLGPEQVFHEDTLLDWAKQYNPEQVFSTEELESWAESNGYILE